MSERVVKVTKSVPMGQFNKAGVWTLDWTMDWSMDWNIDSILQAW